MRWLVRFLVLLVLAWIVYAASPYYALYDLARAVEARDVEGLKTRINFYAVRISLSRQLVTAYLVATGREAELKSQNRGLVVVAGATLAEPLLADYVSPESLADILSGRRSVGGGAAGGGGAGGGVAAALRNSNLGLDSLDALWRLFLESETRGFRVMTFPVPPGKAPPDQFRLTLRLSGLTWRLSGLEVPRQVLGRLVEEMKRRELKPTAG